MRAIVLKEIGKYPELEVRLEPICKSEERLLVNVKCAGLNRRDYYMSKGLYPGIKLPVIPGSDGAGVVEGREVIIQPGKGWQVKSRVQPPDYTILGMPEDGTFAEKICLERSRLFPKPKHLSFEEASVLGLGGLTAYRALFTRGECMETESVLVTGAGGGVASMAIQFAVAAGAKVYTSSSSEKKIELAKVKLGAIEGVNYNSDGWPDELKKHSGGFDLIIDSAGGQGFKHLVQLCKPGGKIVIYGGTAGKITELSPQLIFWRQISILGSTMGSAEEFGEMLDFVNRHKIVPVVANVFEMEDSVKAFSAMEDKETFGKIVIRIQS